MYRFPKLPFYESFGAIPSSYLISLSYEEQILWLCQQIQAMKEGTPNYNYELLENKPSINHIPLVGNVTSEQIGLTLDYNAITNKPFINGVVVAGSKSLLDYGIQEKLIAGEGILIENNIISAVGGGGGGGTTNYNALSNKPQINDVTLQDNKTSKELGLQDRLETDITTNRGLNQYFSQVGVQEGDIIAPYQYEELLLTENFATCQVIPVLKGEKYDIKGVYEFIKIDENNTVNLTYTTNGAEDEGYFIALSNGNLLLSFHNTNIYEYDVTKVETGEGIVNEALNEKKLIKHNKTNIQNFLNEEFTYSSLTLENDKIYFTNATQELEQSSYQNGACILIDLEKTPINNIVKVRGVCSSATALNDNEMFIYADSDNKVITWEAENLAFNDPEDFTLTIPDNAKYLAVNFTDRISYVPSIQVMNLKDRKITNFTGDVVLNANGTIYENSTLVDLPSGWYNCNYGIYLNEVNISKQLFRSEIVYYNSVDKIFYGALRCVTLDWIENNWIVIRSAFVENTLTNSENKVPSSKAVYEAIQSGGSDVFYTTIEQDITLNADGTSNYTFTDNTFYYLPKPYKITFVNSSNQTETNYGFQDSIFYYDRTTTESSDLQQLKRTGVTSDSVTIIDYRLTWDNTLNYWWVDEIDPYYSYVRNYHTSGTSITRDTIPTTGNNNDVPTIEAVRNYVPDIATTISSSSTNTETAGAKAVYDLINKPKSTYALDNNVTITPVTSYTPIDITTMSEDYNNDSSTFSFNSSTGEITVLKNGTYQFEVSTQIRGSVNTTSSIFSQKGFGFRTYRSGTLVETFTIAEQCYLTEFANLFGKVSYTMQTGDVIKPMGYSRIMSGTADSTTSAIWGYKRTSIDIQFLG